MRIINNGAVRIVTEAFGSPDDPAIVLVMGATASMLGWPDPLCRTLADRGLYVIRFDHRDTGGSTTVPPGAATYAVEDMAADVIAVLDGHGIARAHLMGMSLGGYISQILALTHRDRVRSLTLVASEPLGWDGPALPHISQDVLDHFANLATLDWSDQDAVAAFLLEIERLCAAPKHGISEVASRNQIMRVLSRTDSAGSMFNHTSLTTQSDWTGGYRNLDLPLLVIHGEHDPVLPLGNGQALANNIGEASLAILAETGHELPDRVHSEIADLVISHVRRITP